MFNTVETRMIRLYRVLKKYDDLLSRLDTIRERDRRTDGQTNRIAISISLTRESP